MMRTFIALSVVALVASCNDNSQSANNNTDTTTKTDTPVVTLPQPAPEPEQSCFINVTKKDTVELRISKADTVVTGSLRFKNFEKDSSKGTLTGTMRGDTLVAQYTFQAEGTTSIREVAFLIKDSTATEGYGEIVQKDGKEVYKNTSKLTYNKGRVLKKTNCGDMAK